MQTKKMHVTKHSTLSSPLSTKNLLKEPDIGVTPVHEITLESNEEALNKSTNKLTF